MALLQEKELPKIQLNQNKCWKVYQKIRYIASLEEGWDEEGYGEKFDKRQLALLGENFVKYFSDDLHFPSIIPSPDGEILIEWSNKKFSTLLDVDINKMTGDVYVTCINTSSFHSELKYEDLNLNIKSNWGKIFKYL